MEFDRVRCNASLTVWHVKESNARDTGSAAEIGEVARGWLAHTPPERCPSSSHLRLLGELDAPVHVVSGNSTIIVFDGALGTEITR